jgi:titin
MNSLSNRENGILIGHNAAVQLANNNLIGGSNPGEGNVISGNGKNGIRLQAYVKGNIISYNLIGTDASGTGAAPNKCAGVRLLCAPENILIGNTIAFNRCGDIVEGCKNKHAIKAND